VKILLDEDVPRPLRREIPGHTISTVVEMGWSSIKNGLLIRLAVEAGFEVLLTCDHNIQKQQNVPLLGLALLVIAVPDTNVETIHPLLPDILAVLDSHPQPGTLSVVGTWRV